MLITSLSITNDLIGCNVESGAFVFGAMSLTDKFSNGLVVLLVQYFHPCTTCCVECAAYYRYVLSCGCGGAVALAIFALATLAPFTIGERKTRIVEVEDVDQHSPLLGSRKNSENKSLLSSDVSDHSVNS